MGFHFECTTLAHIMKTKRQTMKRNNTKKLVKKRSVGRPRKSKIKYDELSSETSLESIKMHTQVSTNISVEKAQNRSTVRPLKTNSEVHVCIYGKFLIIIICNSSKQGGLLTPFEILTCVPLFTFSHVHLQIIIRKIYSCCCFGHIRNVLCATIYI